MGWRDLLQEKEQKTLVAPWVGGRSLRAQSRNWKIEGRLPQEHGWYTFDLQTRTAKLQSFNEAMPEEELFINSVTGYLVGNRIITDDTASQPSIQEMISGFERVHLIEPGLDRFVRVKAGRTSEEGPLVFIGEEFPLGSEDQVLDAFLDQKRNVDDISGVSPALEAAFRFETHIRAEVERRRREEEERRQREEAAERERLRQEEVARQMREHLGDGALRRELARNNFEDAARAALAVGGATYLDSRAGYARGEMVVRYRLNNLRLECTCDAQTLRIIDSGICLTAGGIRGDEFFTLESLPGVVLQADREDVLNIYRHG